MDCGGDADTLVALSLFEAVSGFEQGRIFFVFNGITAFYTMYFVPPAIWSIYNGGISYILIATLFIGELIVRNMTDKKMPKAVPLSRITETAHPPETPVCYEGIYADREYRTWRDFLEDTGRFRRIIGGGGGNLTDGFFTARTAGIFSRLLRLCFSAGSRFC
ncbi:MAG: hypothetical protein LBG73_07220 [Spirochaetaceae bacterium]|nr:hypothetical protein [Spirochaetaceae bacterium]